MANALVRLRDLFLFTKIWGTCCEKILKVGRLLCSLQNPRLKKQSRQPLVKNPMSVIECSMAPLSACSSVIICFPNDLLQFRGLNGGIDVAHRACGIAISSQHQEMDSIRIPSGIPNESASPGSSI